MAEDAPAGYYVGRPMSNHAQKNQTPPPASQQAADEQVNAQVPGYYAGRVNINKPGGGDHSSAGGGGQPNKEPPSWSNCFGCLTGGKTVP